MTKKEGSIFTLTASGGLMPQEEMLEVTKTNKELFIGIPKECTLQENRVALVPEAVARLVLNGHRVIIESEAGKGAHFEDRDYSDAGAKIAYDKKEVYESDIIIKVDPPTLDEIEMMKPKQCLISALQLSVHPENYLKRLMKKQITAIAVDFIKGYDGGYPFVRSMSEIAGNTVILIAAEYLSNVNSGKGLMMGGVTGVAPTETVILGAGTVGEFAARAALGLGSSVKVFDNSLQKLSRLQNDIGRRLYTSTIHPDVLADALENADVVIGAIRSKKGRAPILITEEMVSNMKFGSVIIDVCIDQGGCIETSEVTSHAQPTFTKYGVVHYCVPNIASRVAQTASMALSNIFSPMMLEMADVGGLNNMMRSHEGLRNGVYTFNGSVTNEYLAKTFDLPFKDLNLIMAAF
ncbi:MAG: alanine dehydrogenase [Flavobacteriales bacterium]|nr:alanine dehydrogenase [Flavobacteriales bacterium]MCB9190424.1 alanine dehydrogenase [Flavobacteriales bacterium]MCB9204674.1 alanine dehydrogenase [Flavobacteriales bacterium]